MCGILGSINVNIDEQDLALIAHRGPDDFGLEKLQINGANVFLGQRRLSIIDLSPAGHQPMFSDCEDYVLIFNGEIYNHMELRAKLPNNLVYKGHSDTETILYYFKHFGFQGVKDLNGIFSLAFLDKKEGTLTIARDPFGVKPLYFSVDNNEVLFSSEMRALKGLNKESKLDYSSLATLLRLRYNPSPDTLLTKIKKVKPGHYISWNLNHTNSFKSSQINFGINESPLNDCISKEQALQEYGKYFESAIRSQLLSDVEVGVMLSGGVDSALVAHFAKKHYNGKLKAFTIGFEGNYEVDEIEDAKETAMLLGLDHHVKMISFQDFLGLIKKCTSIVEEPLATTSIIPMYYLAELASKHVKVALTGQGADEPLGGYGRYKLELVRGKIPTPIRSLILPLFKLFKVKNEQFIRGAKSVNINNKINRFLRAYEVFNEAEIKNLINCDDSQSAINLSYILNLIKSPKKSSLEEMMAIDTRMNLSDDLLNYTDKITMNFSIECRVPMLDLPLVKFIESLPSSYKLNLRQGKIIHKDFAKTVLPDEIVNRKKKGFQSPTNQWFRSEMHVLKEILLDKDSSFAKVFNLNEVNSVLESHTNGFNKEKQIFLLLSIYYWLSENNLNDL